MCDTLVTLQSECLEVQSEAQRIDHYVDTFKLMLKHYLKKHSEPPTLITIVAQNAELDVQFQYKMQNDIP